MDGYPKLINTRDQSVVVINYNEFSIGRSLSCSHSVEHVGVSRLHCVIKKTGNKWFLYDRCTKGTLVNGKRYKYNDFAELKHGDIIKLAPDTPDYVFTLFPEDSAQEQSNSATSENRSSESDQYHPLTFQELMRRFNIPEESLRAILPVGIDLDRPFPLVGPSAEVSEEPTGSQISPKQDEKNEDSGSDKISNRPSSADGQVLGPSKESVRKTINIETIESDLTCSVCTELYVKAMTSNCSHTFCQFCIDEWLRTKHECPVCRRIVRSLAPTIVLDNLVEKYLEGQTEEVRALRREVVEHRRETAAIREAMNNNDPAGANPEEALADFTAGFRAGIRAIREGRDPQEAYVNAELDREDTDYREEEDDDHIVEEEEEEEEEEQDQEEQEDDDIEEEEEDQEEYDYDMDQTSASEKDEDSETEYSDYTRRYNRDDVEIEYDEDNEPTYYNYHYRSDYN